ncbi:MAG: hypothetical protein A2289_03195 [Deltaproteobacteria bacterium RIFOXYA12_FULL_58_15]|nr:MAG: hypothetical protein A2289_03195 [Deltaproteobacteria bacterium RIFOXYA12_FULL_58_15]
MKVAMYAVVLLAGSGSLARAAEPTLPSLEWQANAENVAGRVGEIVGFGRAYGDDDGKLADAVGNLREGLAAKRSAPAWTKKTSWVEGTGTKRVYFGVGVFGGTTSNRHLAFTVAENRARVEIAKLQNVTIVRKSEASGWRSVSTTATATLTNVVIVDWYAHGATIYALAASANYGELEPDAPWIP